MKHNKDLTTLKDSLIGSKHITMVGTGWEDRTLYLWFYRSYKHEKTLDVEYITANTFPYKCTLPKN